jgi:hypothetical protein
MKFSLLAATLLLAPALHAQTLTNPQTVVLPQEAGGTSIGDLDQDGRNEVIVFGHYASDYAIAGQLHVLDVDPATNQLRRRTSLSLSPSYIYRSATAIARSPNGPVALAGWRRTLWTATYDGAALSSVALTTGSMKSSRKAGARAPQSTASTRRARWRCDTSSRPRRPAGTISPRAISTAIRCRMSW